MSSVVEAQAHGDIDAQNPWPGLNAFDEKAARFFNGRNAESAELARLVSQAPLTVLYGKSGLGKTSLLQAGLFPRLRAQGCFPVYVRLAVHAREGELIEQIAAALFRETRQHDIDVTPRGLKVSLWERLHQRRFALWSPTNQPLVPLFVIDQFEEVFTLGAANAPRIKQLRIDLADLVENRIPAATVRAIEADPALQADLDLRHQRYRVLLSFREDFLPQVEAWRRDMPSLMRNGLWLTAMTAEQAFEAVFATGSAARLVDENTAREIVKFVGRIQTADAQAHFQVPDPATMNPLEPALARHEIEPALLSLVCAELNKRRLQATPPRAAIDTHLLQGTGASIIADFYRRQVAAMPEATQRFIEEELLTEGGYRNSFPVDEALKHGALSQELLQRLVDGRVLRIEHQLGTARVELTHDRLTDVVRLEREQRRQRDRRARQSRTMRWTVAGGAAAAALLLFAAFTLVARNASESQRRRVEALLVQVQQERDEANRLRQLAESRQNEVEQAQRWAQRQQLVVGKLLEPVRPAVLRVEAQGIATGFFVTAGGLAVTVAHVIGNAPESSLRVVDAQNRPFPVRLVRVDRERDLALLQVQGAAPHPCLHLSDRPPRAGAAVAVLSIEGQQRWSTATGSVTAVDVSLGKLAGIPPSQDLIEVDLNASPGFSGAPVVEASSQRVIGIGAYGMGGSASRHFLIPASRVQATFGRELGGGCGGP
ncbi:S1 family peptidase [Azohydromonas caseinilytica]|uniref:Trypsin-like peptidase domain-containing protein n=1 Tax=Azohydromonas caseinilytica TaxID=2728836 RepID=A0A848FJP4_9BURK|nr:serine protease [Azohydromonas caseinilytica]NML18463.1 trypsin-like peptidase domain-containing protein [Azohydromonas caseinilytica]